MRDMAEEKEVVKKALALLHNNAGERHALSQDKPERISPTPSQPTSEEISEMSLEEFKSQNLAVRIRSKVLGEDIWLVSNEDAREHLKAEGLVCYLANEIEQLKGLSQGAIRKVHEVKKVFDKSRL